MAKVIPSIILTEATGRVFGEKHNVSLRVINGKEYTYTYGHKPAKWSDAQKEMRKVFGVASYYARLLLKDNEVVEYYRSSMHQQEKYHRLDRYAEHLVYEAMKTDESLRATAFAAHQEHMLLRSKHAEHDAAVARQLIEAKRLWETKLKDA